MHLMLTSRCNQSCSYCFASDAMRSLGGRLEMTVNEAKAAIDMACASSDKPAAKARISLLGGEPTLHPHFEKVLDYALRCGMHVSVFSNLLFQREIDGLLAQDVSIIANVNALTTYSKTARACLERNLRRYSESVSLSYTIPSF